MAQHQHKRPHRKQPHRKQPHRKQPHRKQPHRKQPHRKQPHLTLLAVQQPAIEDAVLETTARQTRVATVMWGATTSTTAVTTSHLLAATVSVLHTAVVWVSYIAKHACSSWTVVCSYAKSKILQSIDKTVFWFLSENPDCQGLGDHTFNVYC